MNVTELPTIRLNAALTDAGSWTGPCAFYFECGAMTAMFAPTDDFFFDIPDAPLPSLGGTVAGHLILEAFAAANDRLPNPLEDFS